MTPQQHESLFDIFQRQPATCSHCGRKSHTELMIRNYYTNETFDQFVARATEPLFGDTCIMIEWQGMWVGIEKNGYAHT